MGPTLSPEVYRLGQYPIQKSSLGLISRVVCSPLESHDPLDNAVRYIKGDQFFDENAMVYQIKSFFEVKQHKSVQQSRFRQREDRWATIHKIRFTCKVHCGPSEQKCNNIMYSVYTQS